MPSHVTVLFPFRNPVDADAVAEIERICAAAAPFTATFGEVRRFGSSVVWLQPEPAEAFTELTTAGTGGVPRLRSLRRQASQADAAPQRW